MRLTLRTLLAYIDDILEPSDHEDLGKKIESSDFATELIHRSRDTMRRLRLGAPAVLAEDGEDVLGAEMTADANTVAEYLDNTLAPESVAEFERICIEPGMEGDVHLAEVASCHHVLTMVLGEPAEIDVQIRERMYRLLEEADHNTKLRVEPPHHEHQQATLQPTPSQPPVKTTAPPAERSQGESYVPDYLRAATKARRSRIRWITAACILTMIGVVGYIVLTPVTEPELPAGVAEGDVAALEGGLRIESIEMDAPKVMEGADSDSPPPPFVPNSAAEEPATLPSAVDHAGKAPRFEPAADREATATTEANSVAEIQDPSQLTLEGVELDSEVPEAESAARVADTPPLPEIPDAEPPVAETTSEVPPPVKRDAETDTSASLVETSGVPLPPEPVGPVEVGNYLGSSNDVLLRRDVVHNKWIRLPPRTILSTGDRLLALPKFRTHVSLEEANVYLSGGTQVYFPEIEEKSDDSAIALNIVYGRLLLNAGLSGSPIALEFGDQQRLAQLSGSASLAVEVQRVFVPGSNFEQETAPIEVYWHLTSGSVGWPGPAGGTQAIDAPSMWRTVGGVDELPEPIEELPQWIDREEITDMERRGRNTLAEQLKPGESVGLTLLELNDPRGGGRRREVRTLAAEASLYVGEFEPFVKALSDTDQNRYWDSHIDSLREALALSPEVATSVREAFVDLRGQEAADDLMEMVRGFNPQEIGRTQEELQLGALVKLLGWLDSDSLDYRVLAIYNLNKITGTSYLAGYRPDSDSTQRQRALRKLWDRFEANELLLAEP